MSLAFTFLWLTQPILAIAGLIVIGGIWYFTNKAQNKRVQSIKNKAIALQKNKANKVSGSIHTLFKSPTKPLANDDAFSQESDLCYNVAQ